MTLEERLGKIANKGAQMIADANAEEERKKEIIKKYEQDIKALAPRIKQLMEIAVALLKNNIPLGKRGTTITGSYDDAFETDGIHHGLGFFFRYERGYKYLVGIGIKGGGCCGKDLAVNKDGDMVVKIDPHYHSYMYFGFNDYCNKCKTFLQKFDDFEKNVNDYVDNL